MAARKATLQCQGRVMTRLGMGERPGAARPHRPHAPHAQLQRQQLKVVSDLASLGVRGQADGAIRLMAGRKLFSACRSSNS